MKKSKLTIATGLLISLSLSAQKKNIYENLPVGKYSVGFKIVALHDDTRISKPAYNYLGERNEGDRSRKMTLHIWYPAKKNTGKKALLYEDYCYNPLLDSATGSIEPERKKERLDGSRSSVERWFGKTTDEAWSQLLQSPMLANADAEPVAEKFPFLIGVLRQLSTTISNEMLASNGYIVVMVDSDGGGSFSQGALDQIPDMRFAIKYLSKNPNVDLERIGTFGFSGSGFIQVLFAMNDYRIKALADIESGIYMDGLFQNFSVSNYYHPSTLRVPFLHIFSRNLSQQEKYIAEFETKTPFSKRYRLLLNLPNMHHWDFATEGYTSAILLENRGNRKDSLAMTFEIASTYLLNFFNAVLKSDGSASQFLAAKPVLSKASPGLWDIASIDAKKPAPTFEDFSYIMEKKGVNEAINIAKATIPSDSTTNLLEWYNINGLGYRYMQQKKYNDALALFKFNTELHPDDPNLFDSLAEGYELSGDRENAKKVSLIVTDLLNKKTTLTDADKGLKENAEKRLK